jgi:hypothetical protein
MGRSKGNRWSLVQVWEPDQDAAVPRPARDAVVVFGGRPRETWREAAAHALVGASYCLVAGGGLVVPAFLGAVPLGSQVDEDAATLVTVHLWLSFLPLLLLGGLVGMANTFTRRTDLWWGTVGAAVVSAAGGEMMMASIVWRNPYLFPAGIGVVLVGSALLAVLWKAGAFPAMTEGPFLEHPDTPASLSLVRGRRGQVWGPPPRTRTDWVALAVSWLAVAGEVVAVGLLTTGRWIGAVLVAGAALTLPWWWAGRLRRAKARRLGLTARALTWRGVVATAAVTALCWWGGVAWAFEGVPTLTAEEYWGDYDPLNRIMKVAAYVAMATWLSGVWLAFGRRRPGPGLAGAWLVVLACAHAGNVFLGLSHGVGPVGDAVGRGRWAYGFISVVSAALVWQLRRWRPIPGVPDPPVTPSAPPEEPDPARPAECADPTEGAVTRANRQDVELLEMHEDGIMVAEYRTQVLPDQDLEARLAEIVRAAQERLARRGLPAAPGVDDE